MKKSLQDSLRKTTATNPQGHTRFLFEFEHFTDRLHIFKLRENRFLEMENTENEEDPTTHSKLIAILSGASLSFSQSHHEAVRTSQQAADVRGSSIQNGAKAILLR
jgi:hypothetical protein